MSREIKFRGKRLDKAGRGKWAYGSLLTMKHAGMNPMIMTDDTGSTYEVDPDTVGQYTGMVDKHSMDIYEGDKIKGSIWSWDEPELFVVKWDENGWYPFTEQYDTAEGDYSIDPHTAEIVGGTYEK